LEMQERRGEERRGGAGVRLYIKTTKKFSLEFRD
jgi:hypothetical protein